MGNLFRSARPMQPAPQQQEFSWDKRRKEAPNENLSIKNVKGGKAIRLPGSIDGKQIIVADCEDCDIFILDHSATITIDDCKNCRMFIAPSRGSVFLRNSTNCNIILACQQFRTRDCSGINIGLLCPTLPIIEDTSNINFACFQANYFQLIGQFSLSGLSIYTNNWSKIHDFTPNKQTPNWSIHQYVINENPPWFENIIERGVPGLELDLSTSNSLVPLTTGISKKSSQASCLVVLFHPAQHNAKKFIKTLRASVGVLVVQSIEATLKIDDLRRCLPSCSQEQLDLFATAIQEGNVIGFELNGVECDEAATFAINTLKNPITFVCGGTTAPKAIDTFFQLRESKMAI